MENVTVEKAIKRAWMLRWQMVLIFCLIPGISFIFIIKYDYHPIWLLFAFILSFIVGYVFTNITIHKWRIWAFTNVRNVHELKKLSIEDQFIPKDKLFERLEFNSKSYITKWTELQERFLQSDEDTIDYLLPESITYTKNIIGILSDSFISVCIVSLVIFVPLLVSSLDNKFIIQTSIVGIILTLLFAFLTERKTMRKLLSNNTELTIGLKGILIYQSEFYSWENIMEEDVVPSYIGDHRIFSLTFISEGNRKNIELNQFKVSRFEMLNALKVYRERQEKTTANTRFSASGAKFKC